MLVTATLLAAVILDPQYGSLQAAAQAFDDAQLHQDRPTIEQFLAPDFQYVTRKGLLEGRDDFIAATTLPAQTLDPFVVSDHRVLILGESGGVASGDAIVRGVDHGHPFTDRFRYSDVFERRGGKWVVVYTQVTALPAPPY